MRHVLLLVVLCLGVFAPGIASLPPTDRDESRFAQSSRQMLASGDLVDIRFQDVPRYKKPVGIYWLHTAAARVAGVAADPPIWVFRLVSVAGATAAVLLLFWTGSALFGQGAGLIGAIALAGIFGLAFEGRIAKTDAMLLATAVLAQGALAQTYLSSARGSRPASHLAWLFWIAQAVAILVKGPIVPLLSALTVAALAIHDRKIGWLRALRPLPGLLLTAAIIAPWVIAITLRSEGAFWQASLGTDLGNKLVSGQESHGAPPGYFVVTYSLFIWPFGVLAVVAGLKALNRLRDDPAVRFCLAWALPFWLVLELVPTKLPHYVLPSYPALLLLVGWALTTTLGQETTLHRWQAWLRWLTLFGLVVATSALLALAVAAPLLLGAPISIWNILAALAVVTAAWLASGLRPKLTPTRAVAGATIAAAIAYAAFYGAVVPSLDRMWVSARLADAFQTHRPCADSTLASATLHEPSLVFLAGTDTRLTSAEGAATHLSEGGRCAVAAIDSSDRVAFDAEIARQKVTTRELATVSGVNYSNGQRLELTLFARAEGPVAAR